MVFSAFSRVGHHGVKRLDAALCKGFMDLFRLPDVAGKTLMRRGIFQGFTSAFKSRPIAAQKEERIALFRQKFCDGPSNAMTRPGHYDGFFHDVFQSD